MIMILHGGQNLAMLWMIICTTLFVSYVHAEAPSAEAPISPPTRIPTTTPKKDSSTKAPIIVTACDQHNSSSACCAVGVCAWISCLEADNKTQHSGCHNLTNSTDATDVAQTCNVTVDQILDKNNCTCDNIAPENKEACCGSPLDCQHVTNCKIDKESVAGCFAAMNVSTICKDPAYKEECAKPSQNTSTAAPTTTPKSSTTNAPIIITCSGLNATVCCDASHNMTCGFFNCTKKSDGEVIDVCMNKTELADTCKENPKDIQDMCSAALSTTPAPTKKPTTPAPTTPNTTAVPVHPTQAPSGGGSHGQHFDGASFIGGIILCGGVIAIIFFGLKFYRSRRDRNYHTL